MSTRFQPSIPMQHVRPKRENAPIVGAPAVGQAWATDAYGPFVEADA